MEYKSTFRNRLIYIIRLPYDDHAGCLKIGETTAPDDPTLAPNSHELNAAARERIAEYTRTAGIRYELLHTELTLYVQNGYFCNFNDKEVQGILDRSGVKKKRFDIEGRADEWYCCDLETARAAIAAAKRGESSLAPGQVGTQRSPVQLRPEQLEAIKRTKKVLKKSGKMLWNAKMRMGKTLTSLQVVKEMNLHRTIIVTHRPVVDAGWYDDFGKIFYERDTQWLYGSRDKGEESIGRLECSGKHYVYFASLQDLRGSRRVGGDFDKHDDIFDTPWDLIIIDEAHEGTQTRLGKEVQQTLTHKGTMTLSLSGTPFNLMEKYDEQEVFTWDYVMEQRAKAEWSCLHPLEHNPYEELPQMNMRTFDLGELQQQYADTDKAFNFREFFRTGKDGEFVHGGDVRRFLDLISLPGDTQYPFSSGQLRELFHHTFWVVPGVREGYALMEMLRGHPVFGNYTIVNVAGDEDEESVYSNDALNEVLNAIGPHPEETYTITLSCGKLTTGVTVKPWTAVFYLAGGKNTSTQSYMQTIFRVQSPAVIGGRVKTDCYVFDFAPDRTLKMVAEAARVNTRPGSTEQSDREALGEFLNFCPIISCRGTRMEPYSVDQLMQQLKRYYVDKVVGSGFEDGHLYSQKLNNLSDEEVALFNELHGIISSTKSSGTKKKVEINKQGFDQEEIERLKRETRQKQKRELTDEEAQTLLEKQRRKRQRDAAASILRGISIRMPLLLYGAQLESEEEALTLDRFVEMVDDRSWEEFMPRGVDKARFELYKRYYDEDIFAASGKQIRSMAREADRMDVTGRVQALAEIFSAFRNPDKETVLTPWRVVNMHLSGTVGGWCFYDEQFGDTPLTEPRWVDCGEVTTRLFHNRQVRLLEINSKSGLYPLYLAYSLFRCRKEQEPQADEQELWQQVLHDNIFVICKTEMARSITKRTLCGFTDTEINTHVYDDLLNQITNRRTEFVSRLLGGQIFKQIHNNMKFDAIVGNPPYQLMGGSGGTNDAPIYQHFCSIAEQLKPRYISLVIPARWFSGGREGLLRDFRDMMLKGRHVSNMFVYANSRDLFPTVSIEGGICYYLVDRNHDGYCNYQLTIGGEVVTDQNRNLGRFDILIQHPTLSDIVSKVDEQNDSGTVDSILSADTPFGIPTNPKDSKKTPFPVMDRKTNEFSVPVLFLEEGKKRIIEYVRRADIKKNSECIYMPKVFIPCARGTGNSISDIVLGKAELGEAGMVCSQTFLFAAFPQKRECVNFMSYLQTKFFRALVKAVKISQHAQSSVYRFVPLQDFSHPWTDAELYKKYHLTDEEVAFIERTIKPME